MSITYIPQRQNWDCGVAALAMATGNTYERMFEELPVGFENDGGLNELHLQAWMMRNGWAWQHMYQNHPQGGKYIKRDPWPPQPFAPTHIAMVTATAGAHFAVLDDKGLVLDPWDRRRETLTHPDYKQVHWVMGLWPVAELSDKAWRYDEISQ